MSTFNDKCIVVGYAYFLNFVYVVAEHTTSLHSVLLDGEVVYGVDATTTVAIADPNLPKVSPVWGFSAVNATNLDYITIHQNDSGVLSSDTTIHFRTGKQNDTAPSESPKGTVHYVTGGDYQLPKIGDWADTKIKYKNLSALVFDDCFIGDGVRTIPQYNAIVANGQYSKVSSNVTDVRANPIDIVYDILKRDLQMKDTEMDIGAFQTAAATLEAEGIFVGLVMSQERKTSYWIDEMLKIADGVMFYDGITNKLSVKLLRYDYNPNSIIELDDGVLSKLTLEAQSWADTYNKFTFKYTEVYRDDIGSVEYVNTASRMTLGYDRPKVIQLTAINNRTVLQTVANRMTAKLGTPTTALKLQVDFIDFPSITIGSVFRLNSTKLGINGKVFRVMKISGDSETKAYINVDAVEDFYAKDLNFEVVSDAGDEYIPPDYSINSAPTYFKAMDASREFTDKDSMFWFASKPTGADYVTGLKVQAISGGMSRGQPSLIGKLVSTMPADITSETELCPTYSQTYKFVIEDVEDSLFEILGSASSMQNILHTIIIGDEIIAFKSMTNIGTTTYEVEGIVRGVGGTPIESHAEGTIVYVNGVLEKYTPTVRVPNSTPTLQVYAYNHQGTGPKLTKTVSYNGTIRKPYIPVPYIKDGNIVWRPRVARKGATYKNADSITAGEDEGTVTGYYVVKEPNGQEVAFTPQNGDILIEFTPTRRGLHKIKHVNSTNHLFEGWAEIVV